jgi:hypothetical protein
MGLNSSDIPVVAKTEPINVSAQQLRTVYDVLTAEGCNAEIYDAGHRLLAVKVTKYEPEYTRNVSLIRRDGLIVYETGDGE